MLKKTTLFLVLSIVQNSIANNIQLSNITITGHNTASDFTMVQFNLTWENSWRLPAGPSNWDAAWVFVKYRVGSSNPTLTGASSSGTNVFVTSTANLRAGMPLTKTAGTGTFAANTVIVSITSATQFVVSVAPTIALSGASIECIRTWEHAFLNDSGHNTGTGTDATITPGRMNTTNTFNMGSNPAMGAFVHRSGNGIGTFTQTGLQLRWNYGANSIADGQAVDIKVFAVEMVYVPEGSFQLGDGTSTSVQGQFTNGGTTTPFTLSASNLTYLSNTTSYLGNNNTIGMAVADDFTNNMIYLQSEFPKGFNAFYCMKYEISQGQYRDFLNVLAYDQQVSRTAVLPTSGAGTGALNNANRNGLDIQTPGIATTFQSAVYSCNLNANVTHNESLDGENISCNFLSWMDGAAFADWASLRPMTELEFEKACRGTVTPVANEYAWGTTTITGATGISNSGGNNEANAGANAVVNDNVSVQGPMRVGSFATASSTRELAGASYYGIMELSGNLWERTVSVGNSTGRVFTVGPHGNGLLSSDGFCDIATWPGYITNKVTGAMGSGLRGGAWNSISAYLRTSDRYNASLINTGRDASFGFRAIRSAP